jgi:hypothetical protein
MSFNQNCVIDQTQRSFMRPRFSNRTLLVWLQIRSLTFALGMLARAGELGNILSISTDLATKLFAFWSNAAAGRVGAFREF